MSTAELACSYAVLLLADGNAAVSAANIQAILKAANVSVEPYWPELFASAFKARSVSDLVSNAGSVGSAAPAAAAAPAQGSAAAPAADKKEDKKKEEKKEEPEEDDDMGFGLFD
eukprot:TRINITY_DN57_c1_g1_i1.p1 TRINITY_DN57_c1_g1~~TRINITY_DN57_c1_g1_i1.p1  ORF type:complete len:114 (-),score=35.48 TRINITY_DN57_c1_g1_i1:717-1058(-)